MRRMRLLVVFAVLGLMAACDSAGTGNPGDTAGPGEDAQSQDGNGDQDQLVPTDTSKPDEDLVATDLPVDLPKVDLVSEDVPDPLDVVPVEDVPEPEDLTVPDQAELDEVSQPDLEQPDEVCVPDCTGKECGSDGCGGDCGTCQGNLGCDETNHTCVVAQAPVAAFLDYIYLPYESSEEPCCFDFNGDDEPDNAVGSLMQTLVSLMGDVDVNQLLSESIYSGEVAILLQLVGVADWQNSSGIVMNAYVGADADYDYSDNLDSTNGGTFVVLPESFDANGDPLIVFQEMSIDTGLLAGGPSQFFISLPLLAAPLDLIIDKAMIQGQVSLVGDSKLHIEDGKLGGVVRKTVIVEALNTYVESSCSCLGLSQILFDGETNTCAKNGTPDNCWDGDGCAEIYNYCGMAASIIDLVLDVDVDNDGTNDSISIALLFRAIPAELESF